MSRHRRQTHRERIIEYLQAHPEGADDDVLSARLSISPRQTVNIVCRQLVSEGVIVRGRDHGVGKIVNRLVRDASALTDHEPATSTRPDAHTVSSTGSIQVLHDGDAVREFAYAGEINLAEDDVKRAVGAALMSDGWQVDIQWGRSHGIDIHAHRGSDRLILEAKGEGSLPPMRVNYFLGALGELLQRMESPGAQYGLALPAHRQFVNLVLRLPDWVQQQLNLCFFLVRPAADGRFEVGLLSVVWRRDEVQKGMP